MSKVIPRNLISSTFGICSLLYMNYNLKVLSINEDYGLDYVKFNQIFSSEIKSRYGIEDEFYSLITNNKINLANDFFVLSINLSSLF